MYHLKFVSIQYSIHVVFNLSVWYFDNCLSVFVLRMSQWVAVLMAHTKESGYSFVPLEQDTFVPLVMS